jgi:hypothetical protein
LLRDALLLPREVLASWKIVPRPDTAPEPAWSERQRQDGVAVYARPWCEPVWPDHKPRQHELDAPVRAFAAPGEYEPLTFTLHALRAVTNVEVRLSALVGTNGRERVELPAADIDLRAVRYMFCVPTITPSHAYRAPDVLLPWQRSHPRGETCDFWSPFASDTANPQASITGARPSPPTTRCWRCRSRCASCRSRC